MIDIERLVAKAQQYTYDLPVDDAKALDTYAGLLVEWNQKINLTAIVEPEAIEDKHFIDSILLAKQPEVTGKVVDVGSGAGFPGIVIQIVRPDTKVTLIEPTGKRVSFQKEVASRLGLPIDCVKERAEEAARKQWRESFDLATARAVASLPVLSEYCLPLVKVGGYFIAMKGPAEDELKTAVTAIEKLGGNLQDVRHFTLPDGSERTLVVIKKVKPTPGIYPRNGGTIAKKPLV